MVFRTATCPSNKKGMPCANLAYYWSVLTCASFLQLLSPRQPVDYAASVDSYAYEEEVRGLEPNTEYFFLIHAVDESPAANEDTNTVTVAAQSN